MRSTLARAMVVGGLTLSVACSARDLDQYEAGDSGAGASGGAPSGGTSAGDQPGGGSGGGMGGKRAAVPGVACLAAAAVR